MAKSSGQLVPFEKFVAGLPPEAAVELRDAADRIDRNEVVAAGLRHIEAELRPFFISAVIAFLAALVFLLFFSKPGGFLDRVWGAWPILTAGLGFLPVVIAVYAFRIRQRSEVDMQNFDINKEVFLPHGAIYFPSDADRDARMVTLVEMSEPPPPSKYDRLKPGAIW